MIENSLLTGPWKLTDLKNIEPNGKTVFSCFHCGGGSTMGYKLAGFQMLGGVEIDPKMMNIYRANHNPKHSYLMGVKEFVDLPDNEIPDELFNLDILDGSPPCSSFSTAGLREDAWGEKKKFREGQAEQVLDELFFDYINIAKKLKPKIVVAENVKGLLAGKARGYVKDIFKKLDEAGYDTQLFLLNAAFMGVPQRRERTFFIARRKDLNLPKMILDFNEPIIPIKDAFKYAGHYEMNKLIAETERLYKLTKPGTSLSKAHDRGSRFNAMRLSPDEPGMTLTSSGQMFHFREPRHINKDEILLLQTFPMDYDFVGIGSKYVCGMSVPPFMMQRLANQIYKQLLSSLP